MKKNSYKSLEQELIDYFFDKTLEQLRAATALNGPLDSTPNPFLKKRLDGRGGFRVYYYIIVNEKVIISAIHPKSGSMGKENLDRAQIITCMKSAISDYKDNALLKMALISGQLNFSPLTIK